MLVGVSAVEAEQLVAMRKKAADLVVAVGQGGGVAVAVGQDAHAAEDGDEEGGGERDVGAALVQPSFDLLPFAYLRDRSQRVGAVAEWLGGFGVGGFGRGGGDKPLGHRFQVCVEGRGKGRRHKALGQLGQVQVKAQRQRLGGDICQQILVDRAQQPILFAAVLATKQMAFAGSGLVFVEGLVNVGAQQLEAVIAVHGFFSDPTAPTRAGCCCCGGAFWGRAAVRRSTI